MTARPLLNVVWDPLAPPSYGPASVSWYRIRNSSGPHAEDLGGEDRQGHDGAGAALLGAGDDRAGAVGVDPHVRARRAGEGRPPARRDADRLAVRQRLAPADRGRGILQRLERADPLEDLAGRPLVALVDEVAAPELDGVEAEPLGDDVVVLLDGPAGRRPGRRANGARRLGVRVDDINGDVDVRDPVRPDSEHRGHLAEIGLVHAVGAVVDDQVPATGHDRAVPADAGLELDDHPLAAVVGQQELLAPREDDLDRPAGGPRQGRDVRLEADLALGAEAAAEVGHDDPDAVLRQAERLGDARPWPRTGPASTTRS